MYEVEQSLIDRSDLANPVQARVYRRMKELGIKTECPPVAERCLLLEQSFSVLEPVTYTEKSWDFRHRFVNIP